MITSTLKIFTSKSNTVSLVTDGQNRFVKKVFSDTVDFVNALEQLRALSSIRVPKIIDTDTLTIYMEYIEGDLLLDRYLQCDVLQAQELAMGLARFVNSYEALALNVIPNDENFRNYLIVGNECYRIDLEQTTLGSVEEWLGMIYAYANMYDVRQEIKDAFIGVLSNSVPNRVKVTDEAFLKYSEVLRFRWGTRE